MQKKISVFGIRGFPGIQGGAEKHCETLYPLIAEHGYNIKVIRRKIYINDTTETKFDNNVEFLDLWTVKNRYFEVILHSLVATIRSILERPDIVHIHNIGSSLFLPLLKIFNIPVVVTYHSVNYLHKKWGFIASVVLRLGELFAFVFANEIIYVSKSYSAFLPRMKSHYIPNGANFIKATLKTCFLNTHEIKPFKYILYAGRLVPEKGVLDLIKAYKELNTDFKLVIAGTGDRYSSYGKELRKFACSSIVFTGYVTEEPLNQLFSHARLFVLPSYHEGLPIALLEALSYGLQVVVSDIPANLEVNLSKDKYFRCGDIEDLKLKIKKSLDKNISELEKKDTQLKIMDRYNWNKIVEKTIEIYDRSLAK